MASLFALGMAASLKFFHLARKANRTSPGVKELGPAAHNDSMEFQDCPNLFEAANSVAPCPKHWGKVIHSKIFTF